MPPVVDCSSYILIDKFRCLIPEHMIFCVTIVRASRRSIIVWRSSGSIIQRCFDSGQSSSQWLSSSHSPSEMNIASIIASRMGQNLDRISAAILLKTLKKLKSFSWIIGCKTVLNTQCKKVKLVHQSPTPVRSPADSMCVKYVKACQSSCLPRFDTLN